MIQKNPSHKPQALATIWTQHLKTQVEKDLFEKTIRNDFVLGRLRDIIKSKLDALDRQERAVDDYDKPSWPYLQAHYNGLRSGFKQIMDLLNYDQDR